VRVPSLSGLFRSTEVGKRRRPRVRYRGGIQRLSLPGASGNTWHPRFNTEAWQFEERKMKTISKLVLAGIAVSSCAMLPPPDPNWKPGTEIKRPTYVQPSLRLYCWTVQDVSGYHGWQRQSNQGSPAYSKEELQARLAQRFNPWGNSTVDIFVYELSPGISTCPFNNPMPDRDRDHRHHHDDDRRWYRR
jgi:hypothetical protein